MTVKYNETHARCTITDPANVSFTTSEANYVTILDDSWIRPSKPVSFNISFTRRFIVRQTSANIVKQSTTNNTGTIYAQIEWIHQGLP